MTIREYFINDISIIRTMCLLKRQYSCLDTIARA
jgi:hypothetical protein